LGSGRLRQSASYYSPDMNALGRDKQSVWHHVKDLMARLVFGFTTGWLLSITMVAQTLETKYESLPDVKDEEKETIKYAVDQL